MTDKWIKSKSVAVTPILMVGVLVISYMLFQSIFIKCDKFNSLAQCKPVNVAAVFPADAEPVDQWGTGLIKAAKEPDPIKAEDLSRRRVAARYSGRNIWVFITFVSTVLCLGILIVASVLMQKSESFHGESAFTRISVLLACSLLLGLLIWLTNFMPILKTALSTIANGSLGIPTVFGIMSLLIAVTFAASFALIFATSAILLPRKEVMVNSYPEGWDPKRIDLQSKLDSLSGQMADLRIMLTAATVFLVVSVLRLSVAYQWALDFVSPTAVDAAKEIVSSMVSEAGALFSLILAVVYLPAAFIIHRRAQLLIEDSQLLPIDRDALLKDQKFTFSFREALPRILTILGPVMAGPIGQLIAHFSAPQ